MVLRHGHDWPSTRTRWTKSYYNWLETLKFEHDWNYVVIQEYIEASQKNTRRVDNITEQILRLVPSVHASGGRSRSGAITKTGNHYVRRSLVESPGLIAFQHAELPTFGAKPAKPPTMRSQSTGKRRNTCDTPNSYLFCIWTVLSMHFIFNPHYNFLLAPFFLANHT